MSNYDGEVVYSDKWLTLYTNGTLLLHKYYFFSAIRTLQVSRIKSISSAANLSRWEMKEWGIGPTCIVWTMDWGRGTLLLNGPSGQVRKRLLLIRTDEGILHKIGVTCEDVDRFLSEVEKMGVKVFKDVG
jgi:hypothetical protein